MSEGRDAEALSAIGDAFARAAGVRLLDVHRDPDHHRAVFSLAGRPGGLAEAVLAGAGEAVSRIDLRTHRGAHPRIGALDVAPIVFPSHEQRGAACAEALVLADGLGRELGLPVYLYGLLGGGRTRAELRRPGALAGRPPDFGPPEPHPTAGAVLVAARPPLVAFNVWVGAGLEEARDAARELREEIPGVRALGLELPAAGGVQVSCNVEEVRPGVLAEVVEAVARRVPVARAELVGLAPAAAWESFPPEVPVPGFDPDRHLLERALDRSGML